MFDVDHFNADTWTTEVHQEFQNFLWQYLQDFWVYPKQNVSIAEAYSVTLNEIWNEPKSKAGQGRIVVAYKDKHMDKTKHFPEIPSVWFDTSDPDVLLQKLEPVLNQPAEESLPKKVFCQLTPDVEGLLFRNESRRSLANLINRQITNKWKVEWKHGETTLGLMHDFFLSTDTIFENILRNLEIAQKFNSTVTQS